MEGRLDKLNNLVLENTKKESFAANNNKDLHALENELLVAEEKITRLTKENLILARKLSEMEKNNADGLLLTSDKFFLAPQLSELDEKNADEISVLEQRFEQERKALKSQVNDLEKKLEGLGQELAAAESTLLAKDAKLVALQNNLWELEELRYMIEDHMHQKKTANLSESQGSVEQSSPLNAALDQPEEHGQVYGSSSYQDLAEASLSQSAFLSQAGTTGMKRPREVDLEQVKAELLAQLRAEQDVMFQEWQAGQEVRFQERQAEWQEWQAEWQEWRAEQDAKIQEHEAMFQVHEAMFQENQAKFRENQAKFQAYIVKVTTEIQEQTMQMQEATIQIIEQEYARDNPGKPIPKFEFPPLPPIFFQPLELSFDQATDSALQQQDHMTQPDV